MIIKTGAYRISVHNRTLVYLDSDPGVDVSDLVATFAPFKELGIDL